MPPHDGDGPRAGGRGGVPQSRRRAPRCAWPDSIRLAGRGLDALELRQVRARQGILRVDHARDAKPLACGAEVAGAKMREAGIGDVRGLTWTKRRGPVEQAERVGLRARREQSDAELVHDVWLLRRKLQRAPERGGRREKVLGSPRGEAQAEVCLPDLRVER